MASIDESSTDIDSDDKSISTNALDDIQYGSQIHPDINTRYSILKIRDSIKQMKNEWKGVELSMESMGFFLK